MASALPRTGFKFVIAVRNGPDAGAIYQLLPPRVTIGREASSNNVVLNDPRVSRNAAIIEFSPEDISIVDVSGRSKLLLNGVAGERFSIKGGDLIRIGETEFSFVVEAMQLPAVISPAALAPPTDHLALVGGGAAPRANKTTTSALPPPKAGKSGGRGPFYIIVGLLFAGMIYVGMSEPAAKKLNRGLRTTSEIEKEITETDARVAEVAKQRSFRTEEEKTRFEEAQKHYIEGFRDYQKGNYIRAMRSFETARAIDPEHVLSRRYYRQAEKQRDEAITQLLLEGRRYREKNMFSRCAASIEKALVMLPNRDDLKFKQAEAMKKECDLLQDRRY